MNKISFPGFGIDNLPIEPVLFKVGNFPIYWYAVIITIGLILAFIYALKVKERFGLNEDNIFDGVIICVPSAVIGARLYYVIFAYQGEFNSFSDIINIRQGGLAIYGGIIATCIALVIFAKIKKLSLASLFDVTALGLLIGQAIGRWGNFVNQEAYGSVTDLPWRMNIFNKDMGEYQDVHPTFLYESIWNIIGFILLHFYSKRSKKRFKGEIALLYVVWYGFGRGFIEGLRTDSLMFGELRISQALGFLTAFVAAIIIAFIKFKNKDKIYETQEEEVIESDYVKMFSDDDALEDEENETEETEEIQEIEETQDEEKEEVLEDGKDN